jgi:uncharacterized protein YjbI with pentapeptide repeats
VNALRVRVIASACALLAGCDGVGRALVSSRAGGDVVPPMCPQYDCQAVEPIPPTRDGVEPSGVYSCQDAPLEPACDAGPAAEPAANAPQPAQCGRVLSLDEGGADPFELGTLTCERVVLERTARGAEATLRLTDVRWRQLDVAVRSSVPFVLELERATLDDVRLSLVGPISVRVIEPRDLTQLQVSSDHAAAELAILDGRVAILRAGAPDAVFAGSITIERAFVRDARILARRMQVESSDLDDVVLETEQLQLADCTGRRLLMSFDEALLTASSLSHVNVERCGRLALYDASLTSARLPACATHPTRVYNTTIVGSSIEGQIVADYAQFSGVRVGALDATDLQLWETSLSSVNFCAGTNSVKLGVRIIALCVSCFEDDGTQVPFTACRTGGETENLSRACGALFAPPRCDPELERMRPSSLE